LSLRSTPDYVLGVRCGVKEGVVNSKAIKSTTRVSHQENSLAYPSRPLRVKYCLPDGFGCILSWSSFRGRGFCCPASPLILRRAFNSTCPPGALSARYPAETISCVYEKYSARSSPAMSYGLCCLYCGPAYCRASYCATDSVSRAFDRSRVRAPVCRSRVHPKASAVSADDKIFENGVVARRVSPFGSNPSLASPLLRIGDPSPYAPSPHSLHFQICSTSVPNRNLIRHCRKAITACKFLQPFRRLLQTRISPLPCHLKLPASRPAQSACSMPRDDNRSARCHGDWRPAKT
jgi:hypothetical protein